MAKFEIVGHHHIFEIPSMDGTEKWLFDNLYIAEQMGINPMIICVYNGNFEINIFSETIDEQLAERERKNLSERIREEWKRLFHQNPNPRDIYYKGFPVYRKTQESLTEKILFR
jgi:hypothetical protein